MDEKAYRLELRNLFLGQLRSTLHNLPEKVRSSTVEIPMNDKHGVQHQSVKELNGGDADRIYLYTTSFYTNSDESAVESCSQSVCSPQSKIKSTQTSSSYPSQQKCLPGSLYTCNSNSFLESTTKETEYSETHKTPVTKRSSKELRKIVKSKCKLAEVIDKTIKQLNAESKAAPAVEDKHLQTANEPVYKPLKTQKKTKQPVCSRCGERFVFNDDQIQDETNKDNVLHCQSGEMLTISVDDVVNTKVINPMIRKLQRMYLNSLKEEMSLLEDLELLPHRVSEVYKATIFKPRDKN